MRATSDRAEFVGVEAVDRAEKLLPAERIGPWQEGQRQVSVMAIAADKANFSTPNEASNAFPDHVAPSRG
jgi:hypothetical protein